MHQLGLRGLACSNYRGDARVSLGLGSLARGDDGQTVCIGLRLGTWRPSDCGAVGVCLGLCILGISIHRCSVGGFLRGDLSW